MIIPNIVKTCVFHHSACSTDGVPSIIFCCVPQFKFVGLWGYHWSSLSVSSTVTIILVWIYPVIVIWHHFMAIMWFINVVTITVVLITACELGTTQHSMTTLHDSTPWQHSMTTLHDSTPWQHTMRTLLVAWISPALSCPLPLIQRLNDKRPILGAFMARAGPLYPLQGTY